MLPRFKRGHVQINCISQRINATEHKMVKHVLGLKKKNRLNTLTNACLLQ